MVMEHFLQSCPTLLLSHTLLQQPVGGMWETCIAETIREAKIHTITPLQLVDVGC